MKKILPGLLLWLGTLPASTQTPKRSALISEADLAFLQTLTKAVVEKARVLPGQKLSEANVNNSGGTLITPGGNYPPFWIRDYAMALESGFVTGPEQKHMLNLTASTQCDRTWITKTGSLIPYGSIADHIRLSDSLPIYFPGTYNFEEQGDKNFGRLPPYCDQFYFVQMAWYYVKSTGDRKILTGAINGKKLIDRLETAFALPASRLDNEIVYTTDAFRAVDFGFRDVITITGDLCFPSLLKYQAAKQLAELFEKIEDKAKAAHYLAIAAKIRKAIPYLFSDGRGMLRASTGKSNQPDVWATALAAYLGVLEGNNLIMTSRFLAEAYRKGILDYKGNIRHVLTTDDFHEKTAWEFSLADKNKYQNGAYWGTPTGWVAWTIAQTEPESARQLVKAYVDDLRQNDFRKGTGFGAPFECFHPSGYQQNPVYMTTVAGPYIVFKD